tara:strand:+ start:593 stop:1201 length:609 start_codon:yes stop_codon:yes gene_type:complete
MIDKFSPETVREYPGLELFNRESCNGDRIVQLSDVDFNFRKEKLEIPRFKGNLRLAYFGTMGSLNGIISNEGVSIHNGFHRLLLMYSLVGEEGYVPVRMGDDGPITKVQEPSIGDELQSTIEKNDLPEIAVEEIKKLDTVESHYGLPLLWTFWNPRAWKRMLENYYYNDMVQQYVRGDRQGKKLTPQHEERLHTLFNSKEHS